MRSLLRGIVAVVAGILVVVVPSIGTDAIMSTIGLLPSAGRPNSNGLFLLALAYRTIYGIAGSYVAARLAPSRPMTFALLLGVIGLVASVGGLLAAWYEMPTYGPLWYPVAFVILALPQAWIGGRLFQARTRRAT